MELVAIGQLKNTSSRPVDWNVRFELLEGTPSVQLELIDTRSEVFPVQEVPYKHGQIITSAIRNIKVFFIYLKLSLELDTVGSSRLQINIKIPSLFNDGIYLDKNYIIFI
jgi:hypothetical protein